MAGYDNIKDKGFDHRSTEEVREIQKTGGINSGKARRKKATLKRIAAGMIDGDDMTDMVVALMKAALNPHNNHQVAAISKIQELLGEDKTPADVREQNARINKLKAETERIKNGGEAGYDDGIEVINDAPPG